MGFGFGARGPLWSPIWASSVCWYEVYFVQDFASCFDFCKVGEFHALSVHHSCIQFIVNGYTGLAYISQNCPHVQDLYCI